MGVSGLIHMSPGGCFYLHIKEIYQIISMLYCGSFQKHKSKEFRHRLSIIESLSFLLFVLLSKLKSERALM